MAAIDGTHRATAGGDDHHHEISAQVLACIAGCCRRSARPAFGAVLILAGVNYVGSFPSISEAYQRAAMIQVR